MAIKGAKRILALKHRKARNKERRFLIEGIRLAEEALGSGAGVDQMLFCREMLGEDERLTNLFREARARKIPVQQTDRRAMRGMGENQSLEGVLGVLPMPSWDRAHALASNRPFLLLDRIRDPGNLGLMLRTAEAAGVGALFLSRESVELFNSKVVRASKGSIFRLPVFTDEDLISLINDLRSRNVAVLCSRTSGKPYFEISGTKRFALVLGNETVGVGQTIADVADVAVTIPTSDQVDSLNVAVAAGILLFHLTQRESSLGP